MVRVDSALGVTDFNKWLTNNSRNYTPWDLVIMTEIEPKKWRNFKSKTLNIFKAQTKLCLRQMLKKAKGPFWRFDADILVYSDFLISCLFKSCIADEKTAEFGGQIIFYSISWHTIPYLTNFSRFLNIFSIALIVVK